MLTIFAFLLFLFSTFGKPSYIDWQELDGSYEAGLEFDFCSPRLWYCEFIQLFSRNESLVGAELSVELI